MTDTYRPYTAIYFEGVAIASDIRESDVELDDSPRMIGNLMSVLTPATPPEPRNARLICRMGLVGPKPRARARPARSVEAEISSSDVERELLDVEGERQSARLRRRSSLRLAAGLG